MPADMTRTLMALLRKQSWYRLFDEMIKESHVLILLSQKC